MEGTKQLKAQKMLNFKVEAKQMIKRLQTPTITIGLSPGISVSTILQVLSLLREKNNFSFDIVEAKDSIEVTKSIEEGEIDIGIVREVIPFEE